jgi:NAD(P)-dependent dehydrogenase (short-subunit alcohol dehydrogenase family)
VALNLCANRLLPDRSVRLVGNYLNQRVPPCIYWSGGREHGKRKEDSSSHWFQSRNRFRNCPAVGPARRTESEAADAASKLRSEGIEAEALALDVTKTADRTVAAKFIESRYGKLDILVNNAGVGPADGLIGLRASESAEEELQNIFNINLFSLVALTREFLPLLKKSDAGRIVNLASILGSLTLQAMDSSPIAPPRKFAYNASKTAVNAFTIHLAAELKDTNIKVNSVHPGWVKTALGSEAAPMSVPDGAKTTVAVALLGSDSPSGRFIHEINKELPW